MATNLKIDPKLLTKAQRIGKKKTKRETVVEALTEYIQRREIEGLIALFGTIDFDPAYDHKKARQRGSMVSPARKAKAA